MNIVCYPTPVNKKKARDVCEAFVLGARKAGIHAEVCARPVDHLLPGTAFFYGVRPAIAHLWQQAKVQRRTWFYADNAYFDVCRERHFRITRGAIQHTGKGDSDCQRFDSHRIEVKPMRDGETVILAKQSAEFMETIAGDPLWSGRMEAKLSAECGDRLVVRTKQTARPLREDLKNAGRLVTWSSAAAITALLAGVRVVCAPQCCAMYADDRRRWAGVLADNEWSLEEIAGGACNALFSS